MTHPDSTATTSDLRVQFDAEVTFRNGGSLQVHDFRLDVDRADLDRDDVALLLVRHLGLLMVDTVAVDNVTVIHEQHKGSRGVADIAPAIAPAEAADAAPSARRLVELSHPIEHGMVTYPGLPGPELNDHLSREASHGHYSEGTEFQIGRITMVANTGTYVDTPFHRFRDGADLNGVGLERLVDLDGILVRVSEDVRGGQDVPTGQEPDRAIDVLALAPHDVTGRAVLIHTGWDRRWGTEQYNSGHPFLTRRAAQWLVTQRPALVGIDSLNIDDTDDGTRPAHTLLLAAGIPVVEHLRGMEQLPASGFRFHAAPPRVVGMGTFPVRAFAVIDGVR